MNTENVTRKLTYGEKYVGLTFNPSGDPRVNRVKIAAAALIDAINETSGELSEHGLHPNQELFFDQAEINTLTAQMQAVKALTWKYN